jgi:hypothetical protein
MVQGTYPTIYYKWIYIYINRWNFSFKMKGENLWMKIICEPQAKSHYLALRSILSLNNPQNNEMIFCENMNLTCWKSL